MKHVYLILFTFWTVSGTLHAMAIATGGGTSANGFWLAASVLFVIVDGYVILRPTKKVGS